MIVLYQEQNFFLKYLFLNSEFFIFKMLDASIRFFFSAELWVTLIVDTLISEVIKQLANACLLALKSSLG